MDQNIKAQYKLAPAKIKDIILSSDTNEILFNIEEAYNVPQEKRGNDFIDKEVDSILLGLTHPRDLLFNLQKTLGTSSKDTQKIANEIKIKIFAPVKDYLIELYQMEKDEAEKFFTIKQENTEKEMITNSNIPFDVPQRTLVLNKENVIQKTIHQTTIDEPTSIVFPTTLPPISIDNILMGIARPKDFVESLEEVLGVSREEARQIAKESIESVFAPVKDYLIELYKKGRVEEEEKMKFLARKNTFQEIASKNAAQNPFEEKLKQVAVESSELSTNKTEDQLIPLKIPIKTPRENNSTDEIAQSQQQKDIYRESIDL